MLLSIHGRRNLCRSLARATAQTLTIGDYIGRDGFGLAEGMLLHVMSPSAMPDDCIHDAKICGMDSTDCGVSNMLDVPVCNGSGVEKHQFACCDGRARRCAHFMATMRHYRPVHLRQSRLAIQPDEQCRVFWAFRTEGPVSDVWWQMRVTQAHRVLMYQRALCVAADRSVGTPFSVLCDGSVNVKLKERRIIRIV